MKNVEYKKMLQNRTVEPSVDSWEKLRNKLTEHEHKKQRKYRPYYRYTALILVLISLGVYFIQPGEEINSTHEIVAPATKKNIQPDPDGKNGPKTEMATAPKISPPGETVKEEVPIQSKEMEVPPQNVAYSIKETGPVLSEGSIEEQIDSVGLKLPSLPAGDDLTAVRSIEDEVDQLLNRSTIHLSSNDGMVVKKTVNADDLLNEIEDDLDKDLKQRLFEKIVRTIKNPKEAITYQEN